MKKVTLFLLAFVLVLGYSCGDSASTVEEMVEEVEETTEEMVEEVEEATSSSDLPSFESDAANEFVASYDAYVNKTIDMLKAGDFEGMATMQEEGTALATKSAEMMTSMSAEDAKKMTDYITAKTEEMSAAAGM